MTLLASASVATPLTQARAAAAGNIRPTAIRVPNAWKPATRFMTTSVMNANTMAPGPPQRAGTPVKTLHDQSTPDNGEGKQRH